MGIEILKKIFIGLLVISAFSIVLISIIGSFSSNYGVSNDVIDTVNKYDESSYALNQSSKFEDKLKGLEENTSITDVADLVVFGSYRVFMDSLSAIPVVGKILVYTSNDLGIDVRFTMALMAVVIFGVIFALAILFIQVLK